MSGVEILLAKAWDVIGVRGAIAIAFALALIFVMARADTLSDRLERSQSSLALTKKKLSISNASINTLEGKLAEFIGAGAAARVAQVEAIEAQARRSADLKRQADAIRAEMAALGPRDPCQCGTPRSILDSEGL